MSTTPIGSYKLFQKLHPLSLLAQLTSRRATGCLSVFTGIVYWSIYLEDGKLTYASYSDKLFERLDSHLRRLSQQIPALNSATRIQMRLMFETKNEHQSILNADYQAICWLVNQDLITPVQAGNLIDELAKEVLESFLCLKEGSYEFSPENSLNELPKFCRLDLRLLVEHCQKQLRNRQNIQSSIPAGASSQVLPQLQIKLGQKSPRQINFDISENNNLVTELPVGKTTYTIACIDDSQTVLNSIKHFLDENTFSVVMINDPVKALMQILRSKPDLILLDVEMPSLDGYELCSLLRKHSAFKNIPIIMVTGRTGFIDRAKAKMVRSSGYLTKPFTQSELLKMVFKYLD
ncbi:chemotaxis protein CheY [Nostoc linckia z18]|uniref:Protein PatA n=2 Tax=Nostoc linckia TaxID=92942 RepID=A0A9Q5ZEU9_NOSLI|nr:MULTISPECIES: response regulator [Nostoc]PHK40122.1 chemotaxis protein CheY [Nostoc linckia z15]PHK46255.1 chemotaxis protein CheY [Nostoc linckia z16]MBC1240549.1 response regulator [Nostoc sp. 2RC]PHJ66510.1 chemotaxis protein CheY [Nostoc linckia z1]PHJ71385.1 chemotaxis protein CheY [Nostoc linckia z3]